MVHNNVYEVQLGQLELMLQPETDNGFSHDCIIAEGTGGDCVH